MIIATLIYIIFVTALLISTGGMSKQRFNIGTNAAIKLNKAALIFGTVAYVMVVMLYLGVHNTP
jgi:hypothetical protein